MPNLADIKLLALDVDGVLTDGNIVINADGTESKFFDVQDGHGIRMWLRAGLKIAIFSGRYSPPTEIRAKQFGIEHVFQNCHDKLPVLEKFLQQQGLSPKQVVYIGDDLPDLLPMRFAGFGVAVENAVDEVKQHADFVTAHPGGKGAVREVIEYILKSTGRWQELMTRYLPEENSGQ